MKFAHYVEMRVFCKEEDDEESILSTIKKLFPFDLEENKIPIESRTAYGFEDKKIKILTVGIKRSKLISMFLKQLMENLSKEDKDKLVAQLDSRLDETLHFYIRLNKDALLDKRYELTDSGNCFHLKIAVAAFPHKRDAAKKVLLKLII